MRLFLLLFATFLTIACNAQSNNTTNTVNLNRATAEKLFVDAQQKALLEVKVVSLEEDITNLKAAIGAMQNTINEMDAKDSVHLRIVATYQNELALKEQQLQAAKGEVKRLEKALRNQKRKTKLVAFAGLALSGAVAWLFTR